MRLKKLYLTLMLVGICFTFAGCGNESKPDIVQEKDLSEEKSKEESMEEIDGFEEEPEVEVEMDDEN